MMTGERNGTVYGYNYSNDNFYYVASWMQASSYFHDAGVDNMLWEGNDGNGFSADNIHGTANFGTAFRNRWNGWEPGKDLQTSPIIIQSSNRYMNIVGNVLGEPGITRFTRATRRRAAIRTSRSSRSAGRATATRFAAQRPQGRLDDASLGNHDVVSGTRFNASEAPSGLPIYASAAPSSNTLPASMYKSARPTWFGSVAWPAIGPDRPGATCQACRDMLTRSRRGSATSARPRPTAS